MTKRVFIALNFPAAAKGKLAGLLKKLKKINPNPAIRYVKPTSVHLTLHFLDDRTNGEIAKIKEVLKNVANDYNQTTLVTGAIDAFPNLKYPRVIFLTAEEKNRNSLINFQKKLGVELAKAGINVDRRPWQPHLTLARLAGSAHFKTEKVFIPELTIPITSVEIMESQLGAPGGQYKIIESYNLKPNA